MEARKTNAYELIIVGGGPAGMTAGLYASRARLRTLLIENARCGGQMTTTELIENYPGFPQGVSGEELSRLMEEQAKRFGMDSISDEVVEIGLEKDLKRVKTYEGEFFCRALIICTGTEYRKLGVPGEEELKGGGSSDCSAARAVCS